MLSKLAYEDDEEDVIPEKSELGKYEKTLDVQTSFAGLKVDDNGQETDTTIEDGEDKSIVEDDVSESSKFINPFLYHFYTLIAPSRLAKVFHLYSEFLSIFPDNVKILEYLDDLNFLEDPQAYEINREASYLPQLIWTFIRISLSKLREVWVTPIELRAIKGAQTLALELKRCWAHFLEIISNRDLMGLVVETMCRLKRLLLFVCSNFEKEMRSLCQCITLNATLANYSKRLEKGTGRKHSMRTIADLNLGFTSFSELQSLTELAFEQILLYCLTLSTMYCWCENADSYEYKPTGVITCSEYACKIMKSHFWNFWEEFTQRQAAAAKALEEKRARMFAIENQLLRNTKRLKKRLTETVSLLENVERITKTEDSKVKASELLSLKASIESKLTAIGDLGAMERSLIHKATSSQQVPYVSQVPCPQTTDTDKREVNINEPSKEAPLDNRSTFENEVADRNNQGEHGIEIERQDEVYEFVSTGTGQENTEPTEDETVTQKIQSIAQKALMEQLKDYLKSRRLDTRKREHVAHFRLYGKYPDDTDEEECQPGRVEINHVKADANDVQSPEEEINLEPAPFGDDEFVDEQTRNVFQMIPGFTKSLDKMLSENASRAGHGIVPIQKEDPQAS